MSWQWSAVNEVNNWAQYDWKNFFLLLEIAEFTHSRSRLKIFLRRCRKGEVYLCDSFFFPNQISRLNKEGIWIDKNVQRIYCCLNYSEQTLHSSNIPPILLKIIISKVLNKIPLSLITATLMKTLHKQN